MGLPATIPPGAEYELKVDFKPGIPGDFVKELPLYTDASGLAQYVLTIKGKVRE